MTAPRSHPRHERAAQDRARVQGRQPRCRCPDDAQDRSASAIGQSCSPASWGQHHSSIACGPAGRASARLLDGGDRLRFRGALVRRLLDRRTGLRGSSRRAVPRGELRQLLAQIGDQLLNQPVPDLDLRADEVRRHAAGDGDIHAEHQERMAELQPSEPPRRVPAIDEVERQLTLHLERGDQRGVDKALFLADQLVSRPDLETKPRGRRAQIGRVGDRIGQRFDAIADALEIVA
ncbi:hypothetical protein chiPu_0027239, partial [Chiloscyllium punctatum]|nr:hypothetical protein [Chiloscyllium punctatum]